MGGGSQRTPKPRHANGGFCKEKSLENPRVKGNPTNSTHMCSESSNSTRLSPQR